MEISKVMRNGKMKTSSREEVQRIQANSNEIMLSRCPQGRIAFSLSLSLSLSLQVFEERVGRGWSRETERRVHPGRRSEGSRTENHESPTRIEQTTRLGGGECEILHVLFPPPLSLSLSFLFHHVSTRGVPRGLYWEMNRDFEIRYRVYTESSAFDVCTVEKLAI